MPSQEDKSKQKEIFARFGIKYVSSLQGWFCWSEEITEADLIEIRDLGFERVEKKKGIPILFKRVKAKNEQ